MALTKVQGEGITGITITANNQITKSTVPAFFVYNSTNDWFSNVSAGTLIQFNTAKFNLGSHFNLSTYKFTAPVAGLYQFNIRMYVNNDAGEVVPIPNLPSLANLTFVEPFILKSNVCPDLAFTTVAPASDCRKA